MRALLLTLAAALLLPGTALADGVRVGSSPAAPGVTVFPSNRFTVPDPSQRTGLRVSLPRPSCATRPLECADIDVVNTLDGFNVQPRLTIPFSGPIDLATVSSESIFLVGLARPAEVVGINQIVWDRATTTLFAESDELLRQGTTYVLVITNGVRDLAGDPVEPAGGFVGALGPAPAEALLREALRTAPQLARLRGRIVDADVFTTQSVTAMLERIRDELKAARPAPAAFGIGRGGERAVFPLASVTGIAFDRQVGTAPVFGSSALGTAALGLYPGAVGTLAFGRYSSPEYLNARRVIPPLGTLTGVPGVQRVNEIVFTLVLPAGARPSSGWPVAIFGHGFGSQKDESGFAAAASMARRGIATVAINVVGHGGGPLGTLRVDRAGAPSVTLPAGGRGLDQNGDGAIASTEGVDAAPPELIVAQRDGLRQTVVDLMQLVRVIETGGIDADGDGASDLDPERISYFGQSFGGIYGTKLLAIEPSVRAGVVNVPGGPIVEIARLSPVFRPLVGVALLQRGLLNGGPDPILPSSPLPFRENLPLRNEAVRVNGVPGALAIQEYIDRAEWVQQAGNPVAYAPHLRKRPLPGVPAKSVIVQFARGDQTVPNPTTTALVRAGELSDRTTLFRNDLAYAGNPLFPKNPHAFLLFIDPRFFAPPVIAVALGAQEQIATFFASGGSTVIDPDGPGPLFEVPIAGPLPEDLAYIP